jgi:biopolymer transport protein ExbD
MIGFELHRKDDDNEARILPLIDVVFILLIFFMVAGSVTAFDPLNIDTPESISETPSETVVLRVLLGKQGRLALDGEILSEADLLDRIKTRITAQGDLRIELKADADIPGNRVVLLMEGLREAGVRRLRLLTLPVTP